MTDLINQAKKLPLTPGVYLFLDCDGKPLYIGRAVSLRRRVANYFKTRDPRLEEMVKKARKISHRKTANLLEAIILEANLIKKHWPKYNVKDRDNRSFLYLIIPKEEFPRPFIARQREMEKFSFSGARIFGPYQSWSLIRSSLKIIRRIFPYSTCKPFSGKPCFDYQIGLCLGVCLGTADKKEYQKNINHLILLLSGKKKRLLNKLAKENPLKAKALQHLQDVSLLAKEELPSFSFNRIEGYDISHLRGRETIGALVVFNGLLPDKSCYRLFKIREAPANDDLRALAEVLTRRFNHYEWPYPDLIVIDGGRPQISYLENIFKEKGIRISFLGISKFKGDCLVFPSRTKRSFKQLAGNSKETLLRVREEAHRFSLKASRRQRKHH